MNHEGTVAVYQSFEVTLKEKYSFAKVVIDNEQADQTLINSFNTRAG